VRLLDHAASAVLAARHDGEDAWLETRRLVVGGRAVRVAHRAGTPTFLFLPGYPDTLQVFARLAAALDPAAGFVALDFPGQGGSEAAYPAVASPEARASWLGRVLEALGVPRCTVFAHDMGVHAALELARLAPERVSGLVLAHALLDVGATTSRTIAALRKTRAYRTLLPAAPRTAVARSVATFLPPYGALSARVYEDMARSFAHGGAATTAHVCDAAEEWLARGLDRFAALTAPVTLLWGTEETHFPRVHAEALEARLPRARLEEVPGGHHWLAWHAPARVAAALRDVSR
jgi:pimeloyl-ACP methyl ester carboxylesterase